jgi:hypothetical protein
LQIFIDDISDHPAAIYYTTLSPSKCWLVWSNATGTSTL